MPSGTLSTLKLDHWQWYGISAGPMFTQKIYKDVFFNLRAMGGLANVNTPKISLENTLLIKED